MAGHRHTRVLVAGWPSLRDGEATAGDVLAMEAVDAALGDAGVPRELAWSPVLRPDGLTLDAADPGDYSHLVFTCGPLSGPGVSRLHRKFRGCRRIAIGVSVPDPADPAAAGFHVILPRDGPGIPPAGDLSAAAPARRLSAVPDPDGKRDRAGNAGGDAVAGRDLPVAGVVMVAGQAEYGGRGQHEHVAASLGGWLRGCGCARIPLDTRLDPRDWRLCGTPAEFEAVIRRVDLVVTMRMHGLVLALTRGVPAIAVDPVAGGAKVSAQARAWRWPALLRPGPDGGLDPASLDRWRDWCLSPAGRAAAARAAANPPVSPLPALLAALGCPVSSAGSG